jgi:hypothetical protein
MANDYRVDRTDDKNRVPCGMNSIVFIGERKGQARNAFIATEPGKDAWGKPNENYGVVLSCWDASKRDYVIIDTKGFDK